MKCKGLAGRRRDNLGHHPMGEDLSFRHREERLTKDIQREVNLAAGEIGDDRRPSRARDRRRFGPAGEPTRTLAHVRLGALPVPRRHAYGAFRALLLSQGDPRCAACGKEGTRAKHIVEQLSIVLTFVLIRRAHVISAPELSPDHDPQAAVLSAVARLGRENAEVIDIAAEGVGDVLRAPIVLVEPGRRAALPRRQS